MGKLVDRLCGHAKGYESSFEKDFKKKETKIHMSKKGNETQFCLVTL